MISKRQLVRCNTRNMLHVCLLIVFALSHTCLLAQNSQTIRGRILLNNSTDELSGTSVNIKGTLQGVVTDNTGAFTINATLPATLVVSRVGYNTLELLVATNEAINITMSQGGNTNLNEVVVISYGTSKARDITGAVSKLNAVEARDVAAAEFGQKLQGRIAGVQVNQTNGRPGQGMDFRIRGAASLSSGFQPLIVVDGQPLSGINSRNGDMNLFNPDEIESFTVLKDAAATALYGSRAANGVIIITTKHAKSGRTNVSLDAYVGWQKVPMRGRPDIMNAREFATFMKGFYEDKIKYESYKLGIPADYQNPEQYGEGTNWYNELLRTAPMQNYSVNISSGTEKVSSSSTLSYFNQQGVLLNSGMQRFSFRTNNEYRPSNRLKFGLNLAPSYQLDHNTRLYTDGNRQILGNATAASPLFPVYMQDGTFQSRVSSFGMLGLNNPVQQMLALDGNQKTLRILGNLYADLEIIKNLNFRTSVNTDLGAGEYDQFFGTNFGIGLNASAIPRPPTASSARHDSYSYVSWLNENILTYNFKLGENNFNALAGYSAQKWSRNYRNIGGSNFAGDAIPWISGAAVTNGSNNNEQWSLASAFGRLNYDYAQKYLLSATIRQDGSSRFGMNRKYGVFPSVSAGWVLSEESFFPKNDAVSFLKLRGSWGRTGNFNIGNYLQVSNITATNYVFGGSLTPGFAITSLGNPDLTWEISTQTNIGADINFLKNRITFSYDYYKKMTEGMLYGVSLPVASGYGSVTSNVGKFKIWGHEFQISSQNLKGALEWNTDLNFSFNDNRVMELPPNTLFIGGGARYAGYNRSVVGSRIGEFYGYVFDGVYMTDQEFNTQPKEATSMVGTVRMKDVDGNGKVDENDRTLIGNPNPKMIYGIANTFRFKNFDLNIIGSGQYGNKVLNAGKVDLINTDGIMNMSRDVMNRWRSPEEPGNGLVPRTRSGTTELFRLVNSSLVYDGSYFTIKNIALGYTIKPNLIKYIKSARVYASVQQAFVFTKYPGQNPEASTGRDDAIITYGQDLNTFPVPRTFMIGTNINF